MQTLNKLYPLSLLTNPTPRVPFMILNGPVNSQMTSKVQFFLRNLPKNNNISKLAVLINSYGGSFSQAHIIINKLQQKVHQDNLQLLTFGQEFVLNSGFLILMSGSKVYADRETILGGVQNGERKVINKKMEQFIKTVSYSNDVSFESEGRKGEEYNVEKAEELKNVLEGFSKQVIQKIHGFRNGKIKKQTDLLQFYSGEQAEKNGIIDGIGRAHSVVPKMVNNAELTLLQKSKWDQVVEGLKNYSRSKQ